MATSASQIQKQFAAIPLRQRLFIGVTVLAVGASIFWFAHWQKEQSFRALYTGLSAEDASQVVQKLKEAGVEYRLAENGTALAVPAPRVAELRLEMAAAGLPRTGRIGFEIFDKTNYGATDFAEHVNFRRAIEGELERSVLTIAAVEQARVHVTFQKESVFLDSRQPAKASVLVKLKPGLPLAPASVVAITHLISSAVEGLAPDQVSVLDMQGRLLSRSKRRRIGESEDAVEGTVEYQQRLEREMLEKINSTLEPLLGPDRFRAAVSIECDFTSGEQNEEIFDPTRSVMQSTQTSQDGSTAAAPAGVPGLGPNLSNTPGSGRNAASSATRRTESTVFQTSRTVRKLHLAQGTVKNLSVSVLVDQSVRWEKQGRETRRVLVPPSAETLKSIREVVAGVTGFKPTRGDQLIVETLPFEATVHAEPPAGLHGPETPRTGPYPWLTDPRILGGAGVAVLALIILFVFRGRRRPAKRALRRPGAEPASSAAAALAAHPAGDADPAPTAMAAAALPEGEPVLALAPPAEPPDLLTQLREDVRNKPELYALVLADWLAEGESVNP